MPLYIDQKFVNLLSPKLELFKWKKPGKLANFRCPFCGDSKANKRKARGYVYVNNQSMFFKCFNCPESTNLANLIKFVDPSLQLEYIKETFGKTEGFPQNSETPIESRKIPKVDFSSLKYCSRIEQLDEEHFARSYLRGRCIPHEKFSKLLYADNAGLFIRENIDAEHKAGNEPAVVIPILSGDGSAVLGVNCRSLKPENVAYKYIKAKIHEDVKLIYGLETVRRNEKVYVCEGEFNSMFLPNAVAVGGVAMMLGLEKSLGMNKELLTFIVDNDSRNPQVVKALSSLIDSGYNVVVFPGNVVVNDINDMVTKTKLQINEIQKILDENTFSGLSARLKLMEWKRC
jgi:ribosomal protein L23